MSDDLKAFLAEQVVPLIEAGIDSGLDLQGAIDRAYTECAASELRLRFLLDSGRYLLEQPKENDDDKANS